MTANSWSQYPVYAGISLVVVAFTAVLSVRDSLVFKPYFGRLSPLVAAGITIVVGLVLLFVLLSRGWFAIYRAWKPGRLLVPSGIAVLLTGVIIMVDRAVVFPEDLNVLFPDSLLFYPVMGFVAEVFFHVLPVTVLLVVLTWLFKGTHPDRFIWPCLVVAALVDPIFQTVTWSSGSDAAWLRWYVLAHVSAINLLEVILFKRYDFVAMYAFRLVYYLLWHVLWGYLRLRLLF